MMTKAIWLILITTATGMGLGLVIWWLKTISIPKLALKDAITLSSTKVMCDSVRDQHQSNQ